MIETRPMTITCAGCSISRAAKLTPKGEPRTPTGWKKLGDATYCPQCWRKKYILRAITMPVASPLDCSWDELRKVLRTMWAQTTAASNWMMTELYARDVRRGSEEKMPPMARVYLYPETRVRVAAHLSLSDPVLYIHGGPRSASKQAFSSRAQLLAAQGWIVFEPNYRGSDNLGNAFQAGIWNDAGAGPGRDVMAGVAALERRGFVDAAKMGVSGWSYGGYMTTWLLGNYPEKWKAAVAGAAVTDWLDQYNYGDANVRRSAAFGGSPYTDAKRMQAYREQSPIYYASKIQAPTLILSDTGDFRVPITQSFQLYHALVDNGVPAQF